MRGEHLLALLLATGCGSSEATTDARARADVGLADAGAGETDASAADVGPADAGFADAGFADSGEVDAGAGGLPATCEGPCRDLTAAITLDGEQGGFQRAYYGLTAPTQSGIGEWAVHLEAYSGGADGCPDEQSPSPDWTLIIAALEVPLSAEARTEDIPVSFLDFTGRFLSPRPVTTATARSVQVTAANLCVECVGMPAPAHPEGFVALDLEATFDEGTISGHVYATHCDSLDLPD